MFFLSAPPRAVVRDFIEQQSQSEFSYSEVGTTAGAMPKGYNLDHHRIQLGSGAASWNDALNAFRRWQVFDIPWVRLYWPNLRMHVGVTVALQVRHYGFYSLNACRIVYVIDEVEPLRRFGFAYGTLLDHAESGEERFVVEWNRADDGVWYDITAFSRPRHALAKLAYPVSRSLQKRFAAASAAAMQRATFPRAEARG
ncbi:MAG: DUF1990 domain-containing protein [Terriglobia bacterium]|nr:DUF1990 domain-containing protein [Terriglobia bacterium]